MLSDVVVDANKKKMQGVPDHPFGGFKLLQG